MEHIPSLCKFFGEFTDAVKVREKFQRLERVSSEQEMTRRTKAILDEAPIIVYDKDVN
ncbi:MAG: hypothetical protein HQ536_00185 [Parcubacteria group bacterium]|nr:hypothetical protein [Parcubacteria group bacterium]